MIYPHYDFTEQKLIAGSAFSCCSICEQRKEKCQKHYDNSRKSGVYTCPYGFTTIVKEDIVVSGIGVEGHCDKSKIKKNGYSSRIISFQEATDIVALEDKYVLIEQKFKTIEGLILELFHDVRKVNGTAKYSCQELLESTDDSDIKRKAMLNILDASNLISLRLDYYQFLVNPDAPIRYTNLSIYRLFERCVQFFRNQAQDRSVNVNLGGCWKGVKGQRILSLVPFVILENAIKYAPDHSDISITFQEAQDNCTVTVTSLGPKVEANELDLIFRTGYRGIHAVNSKKAAGAGLGLSIVKDICERHGFEVYARSVPQTMPIKHPNLFLFSISVVFHKTFIHSPVD